MYNNINCLIVLFIIEKPLSVYFHMNGRGTLYGPFAGGQMPIEFTKFPLRSIL